MAGITNSGKSFIFDLNISVGKMRYKKNQNDTNAIIML